jgi:hypothetical protein
MPLIIKVFLVVNGVVAINLCNPQMLQYVICHLFIMQVDARNMFQGKNKRFIHHNKDHGTSSLKNHTFNEYLEVYKRWKLFLL